MIESVKFLRLKLDAAYQQGRLDDHRQFWSHVGNVLFAAETAKRLEQENATLKNRLFHLANHERRIAALQELTALLERATHAAAVLLRKEATR